MPLLSSDEIVTTLRRYRRAWFDLNGRGGIYLRLGLRATVEPHAVVTMLDIANVEVIEAERRQGVFSDALAVVERAARKAQIEAVFVESITNPIVSDALMRRGYTILERDGMQVDAYKVIAMDDLEVDAERVAMCWAQSNDKPDTPNETPHVTGLFVRAQYLGKWGSHDIAVLKRASLFQWLRSRGGANEWAEQVVFQLLSYPPES